MLGDDFKKGATPQRSFLLIFVAAKFLRAIGLFGNFSILHDQNFDISAFTFYTFFFSTIILGIWQQPWKQLKQLQSSQWTAVVIYSVVIFLQMTLYIYGLKFYGPLRSILSSEFGEHLFAIFLLPFLISGKSSKGIQFEQILGGALVGLAYFLLFFFDTDRIISPRSEIEVSETFLNTRWAAACIWIAVFLSFVAQRISQMNYAQFNGSRNFHAFGVSGATLIALLNLIFLSTASSSHNGVPAGSLLLLFTNPGSFFYLFFMIAITYVLNFVVDKTLLVNIQPSGASKASIVATFLAVVALEIFTGNTPHNSLTWVNGFSFVLLFVGFHYVFSKAKKTLYVEKSELPTFFDVPTTTSGSSSGEFAVSHFLQSAMTQIFSGRESRRIFLYLCINLMFMFVEFFYGWWTNSLGLISDAFHMFFDSTALIIGLFASVVSKWQANENFSYGYGRVEVLSGFINGIFLLFVAAMVLKESISRFFYPQEVLTDKLLLVSVLGLCVNLVGVFAFHDLHGGGDHGHSHSHDHGHGHAHGHGEEKKEKKEKKEGHGHSHAHEHHDHDDHHGHSHEAHHGHHHEEKKKEKKEKIEEVHEDSNVYGVYLHILADTLGSVGVITSSYLIQTYGWLKADPICSFCLSLLIFVSTIPLLKNSANALMCKVPSNMESKVDKLTQKMKAAPGVLSVHNLHIWKHDKDVMIGSVQVHIAKDAIEENVLAKVTKIFKHKGIKNTTVEILYS